MQVISRIKAIAQQHPTRVAIRENGLSLTYAELDAQSDALAGFLRENLSEHTPKVFACLKTSMTTTLVVGLAGLKANAAFTILDARDTPSRVKTVFETARAQFILVDDATGTERAQEFELPVHTLATSVAHNSTPPDITPDPDAICYVEPTSGSTGTPKLVPITQATLDHYVCLQADLGDISAQDRVALLGEMWFDTLLSGLSVGATLTSFDLRAKGASELATWMVKEKVSVIQSFVAAFRALSEAQPATLPDLRLVKLAGEIVTHSDVAAFEKLCPNHAKLINYYGSTECSLMTAYVHPYGAAIPPDGMPVGLPVKGTEVTLLDDAGAPIQNATIGELVVTAQHMSPGYLNAPDRSEGVFRTLPDQRRELRTGDLARMTPDGLVIVGRRDDQVKIRGYSVRLSEVEDLLLQHDATSAVAVVSALSPNQQRVLVAHFETTSDAPLDATDLRAWMSARAPAYMVPNWFLHSAALPRTDTGKILKRALPDPLTETTTAPFAFEATTDTEAKVADIWTQILGHSEFQRDADFFDVGGDSMQAMSMVIRLEQNFPVRVGYESLIMQGATVAEIAARLDAAKAQPRADDHLVLREGNADRPVYLLPVENGEFSDWLYMLNAMPKGRTYIGIHSRDTADRHSYPRLTARDLGHHAAATLRRMNPDGPYVLMGYSAGTQLAIETARAEPRRVCRRLIDLSYAAMSDPSRAA